VREQPYLPDEKEKKRYYPRCVLQQMVIVTSITSQSFALSCGPGQHRRAAPFVTRDPTLSLRSFLPTSNSADTGVTENCKRQALGR
jgi:hypothetical protein